MTTARDLMTAGVRWAALAVRAMSEARIRRIVVVEDGLPVGMITEADLARKLTAEAFATFAGRVYAAH
ncbi:CBS domain-containing protein [Streptomyces sp. NPDC006704]|uniref:CBS domain-containing protein n=1 Tax=Streptomyces sp. NPDC006704 TaxID=3364760 RepID=UPI0036B36C7A